MTFINCFTHATCSLTVIDVEGETHVAISLTDLCLISALGQKCVTLAKTNELSKTCPRKYWMTDR